MRDERAAATLQATALVHEAYLRLVSQDMPDWESRSHFFGVAARLMRQILVDHARKHNAESSHSQLRPDDRGVLHSLGRRVRPTLQ
jgi:hypothetical protein